MAAPQVYDASISHLAVRDALHGQGKSVLCTHILKPMLCHSSHLFYAPDEVVARLATAVGTATQWSACDPQRHFWEGVAKLKQKPQNLVFIGVFCISVVVCIGYHSRMQTFIESCGARWAQETREATVGARICRISLLMIARVLVSNVLPFTSPAFAFLITQCMPEGLEWQSVFYLLICSMPAGAILPLLDNVLAGGGNNFRATDAATAMTDWLPFSFWVRPCIMQPAFTATLAFHDDPISAACAAVLAGHFMIWAGPATTMYQRNFVPDFWTCVCMQPLGLAEDVAVAIASAAAKSPRAHFTAEQSLYVFLLAMNIIRLLTTWSSARKAQHAIVFAFVAAVATWRFVIGEAHLNAEGSVSEENNTTSWTAAPPQAEQQPVWGMVLIMGQTACVALLGRFIGYIFARAVEREGHDSARTALQQRLNVDVEK